MACVSSKFTSQRLALWSREALSARWKKNLALEYEKFKQGHLENELLLPSYISQKSECSLIDW